MKTANNKTRNGGEDTDWKERTHLSHPCSRLSIPPPLFPCFSFSLLLRLLPFASDSPPRWRRRVPALLAAAAATAAAAAAVSSSSCWPVNAFSTPKEAHFLPDAWEEWVDFLRFVFLK